MTSNPVFSANSGSKVLGFLEWLCLSAGVETTLHCIFQIRLYQRYIPLTQSLHVGVLVKTSVHQSQNVFCLGANVSSPGKIRCYRQTKIFEGGC